MAVNEFQKYLLILSEDDAYRDIANGFANHFAVAYQKIHIPSPAGGWGKLLKLFSKECVSDVRHHKGCHVLLLLDFDGRPEHYSGKISRSIPTDIKNRVFVLGCMDEAENIKRELGPGRFEAIGEKLAESCYDDAYAGPDGPWLCPQLQHNRVELDRLAAAVRPFLFSA